jgi:hypothetical protein
MEHMDYFAKECMPRCLRIELTVSFQLCFVLYMCFNNIVFYFCHRVQRNKVMSRDEVESLRRKKDAVDRAPKKKKNIGT